MLLDLRLSSSLEEGGHILVIFKDRQAGVSTSFLKDRAWVDIEAETYWQDSY